MYEKTSYKVIYFDFLNTIRIEYYQAVSKYITSDRESNMTRYFRIIFVHHID